MTQNQILHNELDIDNTAAIMLDVKQSRRIGVRFKHFLPHRQDFTFEFRQIASLAEQWPVVLLDTGLTVDDHADYTIGSGGRIVSARSLMEPRSNLGVQTAIVAGARAYAGTCGSITWLAD